MRRAHGSASGETDADRAHTPADVWVSLHPTMSDSVSGGKSPHAPGGIEFDARARLRGVYDQFHVHSARVALAEGPRVGGDQQ